MLPHRCTGTKPGVPLLRECPFFQWVGFSKVSRTSLFLSLENFFSKNHRQMVCALAPGKLNCNGYCARCNLSPQIRSFPTLRPLSSNRQTYLEYLQAQLRKPDLK